MYKEANTRSIVKSISWRIRFTVTLMSLVYIFIGVISIAVSVGGIESSRPMLYFTIIRYFYAYEI